MQPLNMHEHKKIRFNFLLWVSVVKNKKFNLFCINSRFEYLMKVQERVYKARINVEKKLVNFGWRARSQIFFGNL